MRTITLGWVGFVLLIAGCGPMTMPMAHRLSEEGQQEFDAGWNRALSPVDRLDHQTLLDMICGVQAYQYGVDKLFFRSEKQFAGGTIIMEVHFDRAVPDADRFLVKVVDVHGRVLREDQYNRNEVEQTYRDLFRGPSEPANPGEGEAELAQRRAEIEARWKTISELFPSAKNPPDTWFSEADSSEAADAAIPENRS